jgi:hypothetical protein
LGLNSKYSSGNNGKYSNIEFKERSKLAYENRVGPIEDHKKICERCNKNFIWRGRKTSVEFERVRFCGRSCANSHQMSDECRKNLSILMIAKADAKGRKQRKCGDNKCVICDLQFSNYSTKKLCSEQCRKIYFNRKHDQYLSTLPEIKRYRKECKFNFLLRNFPNEFDFEFLKEHGMYSAKNHGNNMKGISRDHMVSISFGFKNKIPSEIISHPANCKLIFQSQNASKNIKCTITIEELIMRIENWNKKYKFDLCKGWSG